MSERPVKGLFDLLDKSTTILQSDLNTSYLDALAENLGNIIDQHIKVENDRPTAATIDKIKALYQDIDLSQYDRSTRRQVLQLILLRGMQVDKVEPNKQLTPDAIGYFIGYLVQELADLKDDSRILDPAVGTGNLILTVMAQLSQGLGINLRGFGIDNDDQLLELAAVASQWLKLDLELFHQDAVMPLLVHDLDLVVSDLPVGYYPVDAQTKGYETRAKQGHSFTHHLLIEQSLRALKPGSLGLFVIPTTIFQSDEAADLTKWLTSVAYFQGLLNLPAKMFTSEAAQKSILVLQKHGANAAQAEQVLFGDLPDFNDQAALQQFIQELQKWRQNYFKK
ncbi:hypothetical protein FC83_GL001268 [Agrilactobacillus composti DSM 18527 = JCM 14202]|uniref:Uncharacterized protein n=1 Tax=Agrilactobacillus composti DSM 18527 = JCM 14202 TaxID=1423734 RepID=X0PEQ1_9LACO|nr:class I SAM-dependent methyltransferase [Agrilactobacillus composti]KRM35140.1 hypothetical protein FC83_GL001268 [Agrilactobacillus composti DSM 18527 = JCM 14202]GAF40234.1 adenine-specific methyltransferase [Agrilactobacillus composti DSM 18527 = JCM 14202]